MSLTRYKQKRSFTETPEPEGKEYHGKGELEFVVQKHQASHLHYDFRLEMEGVLKSWAVPKGPSLNPEDKRLAMMVEDHPFEYRSFEGIIPKGNYGAGTVIIWDAGTYVPQELPRGSRLEQHKVSLAGLHSGNLKIILKGKKLKGEFVLVKSHRPDMENGWLLIKTKDKFCTEKDISAKDKSVVSGKNLGQVAATSINEWQSNRDASGKKKKSAANPESNGAPLEWKASVIKDGTKTAFPEQLAPMLATLTDKAVDNPGWIYEIKWDGYRAVGYTRKGKSDILSRNQLSYAAKFKPIADALKNIPVDIVVDGEIVAMDDKGAVSFQQLQQWQKTGKGTLAYYLFDLLWIDGYSIMHWPLLKRKELLQQVLPEHSHIHYSDHIAERGADFFDLVAAKGLEGIMAKDANSSYIPGSRTASWLKVKTSMRQEVVITGFTEGRGSRKHFGALVLGIYEGKKLKYTGHTGSGFDESGLQDIYRQLKPLVTDQCPFEVVPKTRMPVTWVKPTLVCEVKFQEWTNDHSMRHPVFMGLRGDKKPSEVTREKEMPADQTKVTAAKRRAMAKKFLGRTDTKKKTTR